MSSPLRSRRGARAMRVVVALLLAVSAIVVARPALDPASAAEGDPAAGGEYHPIAPESLLGASRQPVRSGTRLEIDALALEGVPDDPAQVLAVLMNVSVWSSDVDGELIAFAGGLTSTPTATSLTFSRGRPTSSLVVVRPGGDGTVALSLRPRGDSSGDANVRATVVGWFSTTSAPERGSRILTRPPRGAFSASLGADETSTVRIRGRAGVPDSSAVEGVVLSITARNATANGFVSVGTDATAASDPATPTLMLKRREAASANLAIVPLAADGTVALYNRAGRVDVALHVVGYTRLRSDPNSATGRLVPLTRPFRAVDTTSPPPQSRPLGPGQAEPWGFAPFVRELTYATTDEPVGPVAAVFGTITGHSHRRQYPLNPVSTTQLRVYPDGRALPKSPNLTVSEGQRRSNSVLSALSDADVIQVYNKEGTTHYSMDLSAVLLG